MIRCQNCGSEAWWGLPRPEDICPDCGKSIRLTGKDNMGDEKIVGDRFIYKLGVFNRGYDIIDTEDDAMTVVAHCATGADATFVTRLMNAGHVFKEEVVQVVKARGISRGPNPGDPDVLLDP